MDDRRFLCGEAGAAGAADKIPWGLLGARALLRRASGLSVGEAARYQNLEPEDILVISDDAALPFGRIRMRKSGSAGGQNGLKSIIGALGTLDVPRLRVGIGSPEGRMDLKDWVLGKIPQEQRREWHKIEDAAWEALVLWLSGDADRAMSKANGFRLNDGE